jgi:hypothetical protein
MKKIIEKIKEKFSKENNEPETSFDGSKRRLTKKKVIIISVIVALVAIIIIVNTLNSRKLDVLEGKVNYSDVKNITITRIDKKKTFTDDSTIKYIYFIIYRYSKTNTKRVVKDYELTDKNTVILNINKEYDIYLYIDENNYYMAYKNYPSYKITKDDYDNIVGLLDEGGKNG